MEKMEIRIMGPKGRLWCDELFEETRRMARAAAGARRERNARLAARDAEWAAWRAANGVAEKTVEVRGDGTTVVTYGRAVIGARAVSAAACS